MSSIGMKLAIRIPDAATPTMTTIGPSTAASEYAGEVALSPIARASTNPMAFA
jgi:hypothetical protein